MQNKFSSIFKVLVTISNFKFVAFIFKIQTKIKLTKFEFRLFSFNIR